MRIYLMTIGVVGAATAVACWLTWRNDRVAETAPATSQSGVPSRSQAQGRLNAAERLALRRAEARLEQVDQRLAELGDQVQAQEAAPEEVAEADAEDEEGSPDSEAAVDDPSELPEDTLGDWMDRAMSAEPANADWSSKAEAQFNEGLPDVPGVLLDDVDCGQRFCRAKFTVERKELTHMDDLLRLPVFEGDAFTVIHEDKTLSVFFTAPGVSLKSLRSEAFNALQEDS